jgi:hypothetical protein
MAVVVLLLFCCYFFHIFHVFLFFFVGHNSSWSSSSSAYHPSSIKTSRHCSTQGIHGFLSCWHGRVSALARSRPHTDQCPHCQGVKSMVYHVRSVELFMKLLLLRWPGQSKYVVSNGGNGIWKKWTCHIEEWGEHRKTVCVPAFINFINIAHHCCWCHLVMHRLTLAACYYLEK